MRIALVTSSYPRYPGDGTAPFIKSIAESLIRVGHDVIVVAPYDQAVKPMQEKVVVHRFRYIWPERFHIVGHARSLQSDVHLKPLVFLLLPFFLIASFLTLLNITRQQKSEIIYAHWVLPNGLVAAWVSIIRGIPLIISLHGSDIFVANKNPIFSLVAKWVFKHTSAVTACSPELYERSRKLGAPNLSILLPWGADPGLFQPPDKGENPGSKQQNEGRVFVIASLGRMVYKKGFSILIEAMPLILERFPNVKLLIGGDGPLRPILSNQVEALGLSGAISFPGVIPWNDVSKFLASSELFVLPSVRDQSGNVDGLPTVLLEAMSCGLPIVASDIGGVRLAIEPGKTGLLVPPGQAHELSKAIITILEDPGLRFAMGCAARHEVETRLNWTTVAQQLSDLMLKVCHQKEASI